MRDYELLRSGEWYEPRSFFMGFEDVLDRCDSIEAAQAVCDKKWLEIMAAHRKPEEELIKYGLGNVYSIYKITVKVERVAHWRRGQRPELCKSLQLQRKLPEPVTPSIVITNSGELFTTGEGPNQRRYLRDGHGRITTLT